MTGSQKYGENNSDPDNFISPKGLFLCSPINFPLKCIYKPKYTKLYFKTTKRTRNNKTQNEYSRNVGIEVI